ncbi:MAG: nucleotidyltransferase domain-containing protein [Sedimentisphaerales bacterium]|nr:nucleotidyltransferase domain-containing protein [Sedimentisphaerales bacterium]
MHKAGSQIREIIKQYKDSLLKYGVQAERFILYGSFAQGNPREDSDIDLVVVSESFQKMDLRERLEVLGMGAARIMMPIEAKGYTAEEIKSAPEISFLGEILKSGININV